MGDAVQGIGILDARQNLPPLVHEGKIPANIAFLNVGTLASERLERGGIRTYSNVHTWRSAEGQLEGGDLVYVLAARSTPQQLAAILIRAGAIEGMQLDINASSYAAPTLGTPSPSGSVTTPLFTGLWDSGRRFVTGAERDFFVVSDRVR